MRWRLLEGLSLRVRWRLLEGLSPNGAYSLAHPVAVDCSPAAHRYSRSSHPPGASRASWGTTGRGGRGRGSIRVGDRGDRRCNRVRVAGPRGRAPGCEHVAEARRAEGRRRRRLQGGGAARTRDGEGRRVVGGSGQLRAGASRRPVRRPEVAEVEEVVVVHWPRAERRVQHNRRGAARVRRCGCVSHLGSDCDAPLRARPPAPWPGPARARVAA